MDENSFLGNLRLIYFYPAEFFGKNHDVKWTKVLVQLVIFYIAYIVLESFLNLILFFKDNGTIQPIEIVSWIYLTLQSIIARLSLLLIILFSISGMIYLFLRITKTNKEYLKNLKSVEYSLMLWIIYGFVILIASFIIQLTIPIDQSYLQGIMSTSDIKNILQLYKLHFSQPGAVILLILGLAQLVHFLVFLTKSTASFNKIRTGKAALIAIISAVIVIAILVLIWIGYIYANGYLTDPLGARFS